MSITAAHDAHTLTGPADCPRCALLRENAHWMALDPYERDRAARMVPDPRAVEMALAMLATLPEGTGPGSRNEPIAAIPMYFPGMRSNFWTLDQEVCTVLGVVYVGINRSFSDDGQPGDLPDYGWARNEAALAARKALGGRPGVTAWASVSRHDNGFIPVFTDICVEEGDES